MKLGFIGHGVVGGATSHLFSKKFDVRNLYDPGQGYNEPEVIQACDVIFVSVPVPTKGFFQDLSIIDIVLDQFVPVNQTALYIIRSTILPGTCTDLAEKYGANIFHWPEFLTERTAREDIRKQKNVIIGVPKHIMKTPGYGGVGWVSILDRLFLSVRKSHRIVPAEAAEMIKYVHNTFGALKVTYFNGIFDLCQKMDINYDIVKDGVLAGSPYINRPHTAVPGPDGKRGWGGKCFPKDVEAFLGLLAHEKQPLLKMIEDSFCLNRFHRGDKQLPAKEVETVEKKAKRTKNSGKSTKKAKTRKKSSKTNSLAD